MITFKTYLGEALTLKLGSNMKALDAFMDEYHEGTAPHPFNHRMAVWKDSVGLEVSKWQGNIHISSIMTFVGKNAGNASAALGWLCELADKHQVKMDLEVAPIKTAGAKEGKNLNKTQLRSWYKRNGFQTMGGDFMLRKPKEK